MSTVEHIIGIDLGTTNSVVSVIENGEPTIISNTEGQPKTPSTVAFLENGSVLVGEVARRQAATQPERTISSIKRLIGRTKVEIEEAEELYPFQLGEDERGFVTILIDGKPHSPEQISGMILAKLRAAAEEHLGTTVTKAVITVPAYFDDIQRQATLHAAQSAGIEVMRLINEPTAAAMAYGLNREVTETVAIYDFGGGTFDFSILEIDNNTFEVLNSTGNSRLGGDDIDMLIVDRIADKFQAEHDFDLRSDPVTLRRVKDEAERAKCELSTANAAKISLPFIVQIDDHPVHLEATLSRAELEEIVEPLADETLTICRGGLKEAGLRKGQITKVIMVGGSTRMPIIQEMVEDFFGIAPFRGVNPDEVVAIGAATQGAVMAGELDEVILLDVTPHTLSIEIKGNRKSVIIEKNSTIPIKAYKTYTTTEEGQNFVNIHLLQGDGERASDCRSLGKFALSGIPEVAAGIPRIRVEIFVNSDGVVEVSALESSSGIEQKLVTTCTYLDASERRAQSAGNSKRRKKRKAGPTVDPSASDARRRTPPQPVVATAKSSDTGAKSAPVANVEAARGTKSAKPARKAPEFAPDVVEAIAPEPIEAEPPRHAAQPAAVARAKAEPAADEVRFDAPPASAAEPSKSGSQSRPAIQTEAQTILRDTNQRKAKGASSTDTSERSAAPPPVPVPPELAECFDMLAANREDVDALILYQGVVDDLIRFVTEEPGDWMAQINLVKVLIFLQMPEQARDALLRFRSMAPEARREAYDLLNMICERQPQYSLVRRERASLATSLGDYKTAMDDLEFVSKKEDSAPAVFDELTSVYEKVLEDNKDATIQFKLVKMYLRKGDLDDAISLLQQLVQSPDHRNRANKVMGFCFWQKGLRYLAWQKFRNLPVDEEMKDTLYRIATDMEKNDELVHAAHVLERVIGVDINFRDCADKLKKINYRVELMQDQRYGTPDKPADDSGKERILGERFELINEINRGSMGIVYRARDRILDEVVALKVLNDFLGADPQSVKRFKSEARSARRLTHGGIVRIHDFFELDAQKAISMEYIEGEDMRTMLSRSISFSEDLVRHYLVQTCDALAYAHRLGIVHRDIKPANIMIDDANNVKITDFGIAKVIDAAATKSGTMIVGTPLYMAPEQIDGREVDGRADIYALGIMIYELVTGSPPFYEGNIEYQHLHKEPPPIDAPISDNLRAIIAKCMEKNPDNRFQTVEEISEALKAGI